MLRILISLKIRQPCQQWWNFFCQNKDNIETNFTSQGKKEPDLVAYTNNLSTTITDWFNIYLVRLFDLQTLYETQLSTISEIITTSHSGNKTISWQYDTGEEIINSTQPISIDEAKQAIILIEHNYSTDGVYVTNAVI